MAKKKSYRDEDELFADLMKDIEKIALEIGEEMKKIEKDVLDENVYDVFEPKAYSRRYDENGGLADTENSMQVKIDVDKDGVVISVENTAKANSGRDNGKLLQPIIEEGLYYWRGQRPPKRPFIEDAQEEVDNSLEIKKLVNKMLDKMGW